ncbi:HAD-IA family hydrolase [Microbispora sp. NBRC 16548]|uniref:HAD-IA family hydrolase n=1 Tax=Microbispora sp. NBRC 16548 TaxID=3030994 RepID=UPI0024A18E66|nr:HAD-IA family hydrolase [Microbispora sp. NBRC 16548]GLX06594.1 hypothetical protein Misp03_35210 [Microbispora sp. NBRC 16548]
MPATCAGQQIDTLLCDVGDVIITFDPAVAATIETRHELAAGTLLPIALKSEPARLAMKGAIDHEEWRRAVTQLVGEAAITDWLAYHGDRNDKVIAHLKSVRDQGVRIVLLSNATSRLWDDLSFHGLNDLADTVLCSADICQVKPDPECYLYAAERAGFALERALYIDDTPSWVSAGVAMGLNGHLFRSAELLGEHLASLGLLP